MISNLLCIVDSRLLLAAAWVIELLQDWCSLAQRRLERALIVAAVGFHLSWLIFGRHTVWDLISTVVVVLAMLAAHRRTNRERVNLILSDRELTWRLLLVFLAVADLVFASYFRGLDEWLELGWHGTLAAALYVMAWPDGGDLGGKRRAASEKIVDSFGRVYVPEGSGA